MDLNYFSALFVSATIFSLVFAVPSPSRPRPEKNFSFAIPAFLLGGGSGLGIGNVNPNAVNNGNLPNINSITNTNQLNQNQNTNFGTNLFRQVTVTRTILSTVATVTAPVFRTCTVTPMNFMACAAGRRKRSVVGDQNEASAEALEMILVMGSTTVSDQSVASKLLNLDHNLKAEIELGGVNGTQSTNGSVPALAPSPTSSAIIDLVPLFPSEDVPVTPDAHETGGNEQSQDLFPASLETPGLSSVVKFPEDVHDHMGHARLGLGGTVTVTRTLPVTAVINSTVTASGPNNAPQVLTISYVGCSPPGPLPVTGTPCA